MSMGVCGIVHVDKRDVSLETDLSFYFEAQSNSLGIGTKIGGNVSKFVYDRYTDKHGRVGFVFELTDSPLDQYAEDLFAVYEECLTCRMQRVQKLFEGFLEHEHIKRITLETNYFLGESEDEINIDVMDFCKVAVALYNKSDDINPPMLKFCISKTNSVK